MESTELCQVRLCQLRLSQLWGISVTTITSSDNGLRFKRKLNLCKNQLSKEIFKMFLLFKWLKSPNDYYKVSSHIQKYLKEPQVKFGRYFSFPLTRKFYRVRDHFSIFPVHQKNLNFRKKEEFCVFRWDCKLKMIFADISIENFWILLRKYFAIPRKNNNL